MRTRWNTLTHAKRCVLCLGLVLMSMQVVQAQQQPDVRRLGNRVAPGLQQTIGKNRAVRVQVKNKAQFLQWLTEHNFQGNVQATAATHILTLTNVSEKTLQQLATSPHVTYIDKPNRQAREETELKDADFSINTIYAALGAYPQLKGQGMAASVKEGAFDPDDLDLKGRSIPSEALSGAYTAHATTMATIIAGAGNTGPRGRGIAPYARLGTSNFSELFPDESQTLLSKGIHLQNHSYGVGVENYYGLESAAYDREVFQNPTLLHVFSSGNSGDKTDEVGNYAGVPGFANLTGQFKTSKNTLSVGALEPTGQVGPLSSKGPAYDGRVKPELTAYGKGGTSEAAAVVSGVALLVQQAHKERYNTLPPAALVKAVLLNSADDAGRPEVDFETGFGNTDALGALRTIEQGRFVLDAVSQGSSKLHTITVPSGVRQLKVTLVWHEAEGNPEAATALINDLDLELLNTATGETWKPWVLSSYPHPDSLKLPARRRVDRLNNVEQITLALPAAGLYQLKVSGYNVPQPPQNYSLAFEYESGAEWTYPVVGLSLQAGNNNRIRWQGNLQGQLKLEYKLTGDPEWYLIADNVPANASHFDWQAPDAITKAQLRLTAGAVTVTTEEFLLTKQLKLNIGYNCDDQLMLYWTGLPGVHQYQLYQVGSTHPEPLLRVSDTLLLFTKNQGQLLPEYVSVAPVIAGTTAIYSSSTALDQAAIACYIRNFIPDRFVTRAADLRLELSSFYQVASITLERVTHKGFEAVQTIAPVTQLTHQLQDPSPALGKNLYRAKVTTTQGNSFYSQVEELVYADDSYVMAYPNPVAAGQNLSVIAAGDVAVVQLYDTLGKLVYESEEAGAIKEIPTTGLHKGLYIIRLKADSGSVVAGKVLLL
ncbi:MAG TPA: S8 family serine peptidase [Pontibacter sp.]